MVYRYDTESMFDPREYLRREIEDHFEQRRRNFHDAHLLLEEAAGAGEEEPIAESGLKKANRLLCFLAYGHFQLNVSPGDTFSLRSAGGCACALLSDRLDTNDIEMQARAPTH